MDVKVIRTKLRKRGHVGGFIFQASKHMLTLVMFFVFFLGLLSGNFLVKSSTSTYETVNTLFQNYLQGLSGQTVISSFFSQVLINIILIALCFVFGLCAIGFPVPIILNLIKGISIGALSSFMYAEYALKGFGYCMLVFYPVQIALSLIMLKSGKESFSMSTSIFKILSDSRQKQIGGTEFKAYIIKFLILLVVCIIITLISAVLSVYVIKLFNF